jgi:hypothetical protein
MEDAHPQAPARALCAAGLLTSLLLAADATLTPEGAGWSWGAPLTELRWYLTGLDHPATLVQLIGNVALLAVPAACAVWLWPALGRSAALVPVALAAGTAIEALQWLLPLGRVVSPMDALLNASGAVLAGWAVGRRHPIRRFPRPPGGPQEWRAVPRGTPPRWLRP